MAYVIGVNYGYVYVVMFDEYHFRFGKDIELKGMKS
jgi:hypothetical protein